LTISRWKKKPGESLLDTVLIKGIVLDKEVVHPGMPKRIADAKIALVDSPLEVEKTEFDAKINIENPEQMKSFLDEEEKMLKDMVEKVCCCRRQRAALRERHRRRSPALSGQERNSGSSQGEAV